MNLSDYLNDSRVEFIDVFAELAKNTYEIRHDYNNELGIHVRKEINEMSRGRVKSILREMKSEKIECDDDKVFKTQVEAKIFLILELHGFSNVANEFAITINRQLAEEATQNLIHKEISSGAARKSRSIAASGSRHSQKEEIVGVIRETWLKYPWGSKTRMIKYLIESYRVTEKSLKNWMREEKLSPTTEVMNKNFSLVIPENCKNKGKGY